LKTVAFVSVNDAACAKMAGAFFDAFSKPSLARAVPGGIRAPLWVAPEVSLVMDEAGFPLSEAPRVLAVSELESAALVVTLGELDDWRPPASAKREQWDVPDTRSLPIERLRELRDGLRRRVWRLVAREGWYKLQPAQVVPRRERRT
jgi:hypothetical protein